jgi:hypothetical protein
MFVANYEEPNSGYRNQGRQWVDLEESLAGGSGAPLQGATGNLTANTTVELDVTEAAPGAPATLVLGFDLLLVPFAGGTLVPTPNILVARFTDAAGATEIRSNVPDGIPPMLDLYFQWWVQDAGAPEGLAATNALRVTTP